MSDYQKGLLGKMNLSEMLVLTLQYKKNYEVHYRNLQFISSRECV